MPKVRLQGPTVERLRELFYLDTGTGVLRWRVKQGSRALPGSEAGCVFGKRNPYRQIRVDGTLYQAHMIVWCMVHGEWPMFDIDHKDHNGLHNWPSNLRLATDSQNFANNRSHKDGTSKFKGVSKLQGGRWLSKILQIHIGHFTDERIAALHYDAVHKLVWPEIRNRDAFNFPPEESERIEVPQRVITKISKMND